MDTNKIIEKAKESYDRYFKDAPVFPENHEQDVVCNAEEIEKIIEKKNFPRYLFCFSEYKFYFCRK